MSFSNGLNILKEIHFDSWQVQSKKQEQQQKPEQK